MSTCSEGRLALENGFRHKLSSLENAAARIASVKAQMRGNAEQVKREINIMVSHQLALIRAREQELLQQLDQITSIKETILNQQQETINQNIGACQQSLDTIRQRGADESNEVKNSLFRLGTMDLSPRENSYVALEADFMKMRLFLTEFGKIVTTNETERPGESLPHELEEYDDGVPMVHKSVMRLSGSQSVPSQLKSQAGNIPTSHTIHNWLAKMPSGQNVLEADMEALMKEYEEVTTRARDRLDSFHTSTIASSFEVLNGNGRHSRSPIDSPIPVLSDAMKENLDLPKSQWLLQKQDKKSPEKSENMKRKVILEEHPNNKVAAYEFETVINQVKASANSKWLLRDASSQTESTLKQTASTASFSTSAETLLPNVPSNTPYDASGYSTPCTSNSAPLTPFDVVFPKFFASPDATAELAKQMKKCVVEAQTSSGFDEAKFLENIREIFLSPPKFGAEAPRFELKTAQNSPIDDSDMLSINGWKKILNQNHQTMDTNWLSESSNIQEFQ